MRERVLEERKFMTFEGQIIPNVHKFCILFSKITSMLAQKTTKTFPLKEQYRQKNNPDIT